MKLCKVPGCKNKSHARGYCQKHYDSIYFAEKYKYMSRLKQKKCKRCFFAEMFLGKEIWKPVKGYEGKYEVSCFGRVRSLDRIVSRKNGTSQFKKGIILNGNHSVNGYMQTSLCDKTKFVHILVATAFIENQKQRNTVNHIDGNKYNNYYKNLEWATLSEQQKHAHKTGLNHSVKGKYNPDSIRVYTIEKATGEKVYHGSIREASRYTGISKQSLLQWLHHKFIPSDYQKFTIHYAEDKK